MNSLVVPGILPAAGAFAGVLGMLIGSFLNVVVHRVPLRASVVAPPSACPQCTSRIRWYDNVPVLSWLVLRGRCRDCAAPISARYPLVELAGGVAFAIVSVTFIRQSLERGAGLSGLAVTVAFLYLAAVSIALALIDLDTHTLPNALTYPSYPVLTALFAVASAVSGDWGAFWRALAGGAVLGSAYLVLAIAVPKGMGLGDVKLAGVLGIALAYLGWGPLAVGAFGAFLVGGSVAIVLLTTRRTSWRGGLPFGPSMLAGAWIGIFFGAPLWRAYLGTLGLA